MSELIFVSGLYVPLPISETRLISANHFFINYTNRNFNSVSTPITTLKPSCIHTLRSLVLLSEQFSALGTPQITQGHRRHQAQQARMSLWGRDSAFLKPPHESRAQPGVRIQCRDRSQLGVCKSLVWNVTRIKVPGDVCLKG